MDRDTDFCKFQNSAHSQSRVYKPLVGKAVAGENAGSDFIQHLDWAAQVSCVNTEAPWVSLQADVTTLDPQGG